MLLLHNATHETIWGGEKLCPYADTPGEKIGHLYTLCSEPGLETYIINGPYRGKTVQEYFDENKDRLGLSAYKAFPFILALVEAKDHLSIQVHPDDKMAVEEENAEYGKNESWIFLEAPKTGWIFNGCTVNTPTELRARIDSGEALSAIDRLQIGKGDYVYVNAGTLHAMGAGSVVFEIEENSPWTYRLYDYDRTDSLGRKRQLHLEKGLRALNTSMKSIARKMPTDWIEERRYKVKQIRNATTYQNNSQTIQCITVISGSATGEEYVLQSGHTAILEPGERLSGRLIQTFVVEPI